MTFKTFKEQYKILTRGDVMVAQDEELKLLMSVVAGEIHRSITPLEKIEIDYRNLEIDFNLNAEFFVRKFKTPTSDNDEIDFIDENLINALIYAIATKRTMDIQRQTIYRKNYLKSLTEYEINNFDDRSYDLKEALNIKGWLKPYKMGYMLDTYIWDKEFINKLDFYLANKHVINNLSYRNFIYLFIDYQNKKIDPDREDLRELDKVMKNKIRI